MPSHSFHRLNEDMIQTLFVSSTSTNPLQKEANRNSALPRVGKENRVLDVKRSQNIAIILRALNVTLEEVSEALLDGEYFDNFFHLLCNLSDIYVIVEDRVLLILHSDASCILVAPFHL